MSADDRTIERLARWAERDAAIGLAAELEQIQARLRERDVEVANLRARGEHLQHRLAQLTIERDRLQHEVEALRRPRPSRRAYLAARRLAGRAMRATGLR